MREMTMHELKADLIFFTAAALISFSAVFLFDIHWSFYPGATLFPPSRMIGLGSEFYLVWTTIGGFFGLALAKLFRAGLREEALAHQRTRNLKQSAESSHERFEDAADVSE